MSPKPVHCKKCDHPLGESARFCVHCGHPAPRCQACHHPYTFQAPYCGNCGASLISENQAILEVMAQTLTQAHAGALCQRSPDIRVYPLVRGLNCLGANPSGAIALDEPTVSWAHAKLTWDKQVLHVEDLGSTNGTFLNHHRLEAGLVTTLKHGDTIQFADVVLKVWLRPDYR